MSMTSRPPAEKFVDTVRLPIPGELRIEMHDDSLTNTDYELSQSLIMAPPARFVQPKQEADPQAGPGTLNPEARAMFQQRLALCCLVASLPFAFFLACAATNFIELFGRATVGWGGLVLCAITWTSLLVAAIFLKIRTTITFQSLRTMEVAIFGTLALFFAYWSYQVLTAFPDGGFDNDKHMRTSVLAAALVVHFNWFALIVFHGVLVPNTLSRGAGVAIALGVLSLGIDVVAAISHPPTGENAGALFAVAVTMLSVGSGLSVFGTAKTEALRRQVESARETIRQLGQYRLRRKLGQGGMGEVFLAEHQLLKRPCALKRIHSKFLDNSEQVRRFEREVQATAQLRHPNTVEIYD
jgi:eukaryotic-like serine/threonine-protein kinase